MSRSTHQPLNCSALARLVKRFRKQHHLSLNQLAQVAGIGRRALARFESGTFGTIRPDCPGGNRRASKSVQIAAYPFEVVPI
jgi:DNA-binding XRE family transcriptional regulator